MVANLTVLNNNTELQGSPSFSPSHCNPNSQCGNGLEKIYPTCAVRFGYMNYIGEFKYAPGMLFGCGAKVVIQTERGIEIGQQVSLTCTGCDKSVKRSTMLDYVKNSGPDFFRPKSGRILRAATGQDLEEDRRIKLDSVTRLRRAKELSRQHGLAMKLVECEHLFGGERVIFHFMAEGRIDFRDLVRDLAHEYHTRIEMHQVGARDEARLVADYEICGRECCCKNFLKTLRPVTMRMAKLQKATLDPSKVSGRCGRLRCCLRYEHTGYEELNKLLPRVGTRIQTDRGIGAVIDRQVLTQLLSIQYETDQFIETVGVEMATVLDKHSASPPPIPTDIERRPARNDRPQRSIPASPREGHAPRQERPVQDRSHGNDTDQPIAETGPQESSATPGQTPGQAGEQDGRQHEPRRRRRGRRGRRGRGPGGEGPPLAGGPPSGA